MYFNELFWRCLEFLSCALYSGPHCFIRAPAILIRAAQHVLGHTGKMLTFPKRPTWLSDWWSFPQICCHGLTQDPCPAPLSGSNWSDLCHINQCEGPSDISNAVHILAPLCCQSLCSLWCHGKYLLFLRIKIWSTGTERQLVKNNIFYRKWLLICKNLKPAIWYPPPAS